MKSIALAAAIEKAVSRKGFEVSAMIDLEYVAINISTAGGMGNVWVCAVRLNVDAQPAAAIAVVQAALDAIPT